MCLQKGLLSVAVEGGGRFARAQACGICSCRQGLGVWGGMERHRLACILIMCAVVRILWALCAKLVQVMCHVSGIRYAMPSSMP
jgi:hypothetical protein